MLGPSEEIKTKETRPLPLPHWRDRNTIELVTFGTTLRRLASLCCEISVLKSSTKDVKYFHSFLDRNERMEQREKCPGF